MEKQIHCLLPKVSMLIEHGKAVVNNTEKALVVIDLPFWFLGE